MAKRKTATAEKYWYAVGYHHAMVGIKDPPRQETVEFLLSTINVQVHSLYEDGWKRGNQDKDEGLE